MASAEVYDAVELRMMIKKLKARKSELLSESVGLKQQLNDLSLTYANARQNVNALGVDDEIRMFEGDDTVVLDKKFLAADRKLDVQILNQEIKAVLPRLEQDAVRWEQQMHGFEKQSQSAAAGVAQIPSHLTKPTAELEEMLTALTEQKAKLIASVKLENERKTQQLKSAKIDVHKLRTQITAMVEQHSLVQQSVNRLRSAVLSEETRLEILRKEHDTLNKAYAQMTQGSSSPSRPATASGKPSVAESPLRQQSSQPQSQSGSRRGSRVGSLSGSHSHSAASVTEQQLAGPDDRARNLVDQHGSLYDDVSDDGV